MPACRCGPKPMGCPGLLSAVKNLMTLIARFHGSQDDIELEERLQNIIFTWTSGHVGTVDVLIYTMRARHLFLQQEDNGNYKYTPESFGCDFPFVTIAYTIFCYGIQTVHSLYAAEMVDVFKMLLKDGAMTVNLNQGETPSKELVHAYKQGWLHCEPSEEGIYKHSIPSPFHAMCISHRLPSPDFLHFFSSIYEFVTDAISRFEPSLLHTALPRLGPEEPSERRPTAQYKDEFYRSIHGRHGILVTVSPKLWVQNRSPAATYIDFYIPGYRWGIKIIQDGSDLEEQSSRFEKLGAYDEWLQTGKMDDYTLLDFRMTMPSEAHPGILGLYHVVFTGDYSTYSIYDRQLKALISSITPMEEKHFI